MRQSSYFIQTLRETPSEAEVASHILMLRTGMIRKDAAGIYNYLPLGLRVVRKVENIVRRHMDEAGGIELLMSAVQPAELWQESGRWDYYGKELLRFKDRHDRDFCIGPTHEEVITDIIRYTVNSYKQLPVNLYQIQTKFRDEVRPRFGLMRGREFIMKDAYSFDIDDEGAEKSYKKMYDAYRKIFQSCGLKYKVVDADSGSIGGSFSHEFMVLAETGEDAVISCSGCDYSANMEKAKVGDKGQVASEKPLAFVEVATPNLHTAVDVAEFLETPVKKVIKTMIIKCEGVKENGKILAHKFVAVTVLGDHEVNLAKVKNLVGAVGADFAEPSEVEDVVGCPIGSLGPVGMKLPVYADNGLKYENNLVVGANKDGFHIKNISPGVDFTPTAFGDLRNAVAGDICSECGGVYELTRGIEVGHIFKLGTKYSAALNAKALNANGKNITLVMGCYGIGIGRTAAAAIEQNNDEKGMIWPKSIAPFEVVIVTLNTNDSEVVSVADKLYTQLKANGVDVILDDRNERAGVKFMDAELIGYPLRVGVGKKSLLEGQVECVIRKSGETKFIKVENACESVIDILNSID